MKTSRSELSTRVHKNTRVFVTDGSHKVLICAGSILNELSETPKGLITHVYVDDLYPDGEKKSGIYLLENIFYCEMGI